MPATPSDTYRAIFGSETRARLLGFLADSKELQTGYAISKRLGVNPSKVYRQLPRLVEAGLLELREDESGTRRYRLVEADLRRFLQRRVRVTSSAEWFSTERARRRREAYERLQAGGVVPPKTRPNRGAVSIPEEFERPPEKDRALRRIGL